MWNAFSNMQKGEKMAKQFFVVQYDEDLSSITQEAEIQEELIKAMKSLEVPFTLIPPDVANPGLAAEVQPPMDGIVSFKDVPAFTSSGSYAVDYPMKDLVKWVQNEVTESGLMLCPDFQRGHVWVEKQQEDYIAFLLRGGKTGRDLYFNCPSWNQQVDADAYNDYVCVDGLQRLTAIMRFVGNELRVFGRLYKEFEGRPKMNQEYLRIHINDLKSKKEVLTWYLEMNSGGTPHTRKELRRVYEMLQAIQKGVKNV